MTNIDKHYERFCSLLQEAHIYVNPLVTFRTIAEMLGVRPSALNRKLLDELGMTGPELIALYRERHRRLLNTIMPGSENGNRAY